MYIPFLILNIMNAQELFFKTIQIGTIENLKLQLQNNPHIVNSEDERGFTPLIFATYFDKAEIAELLLKYKANINAKDASGNTALIGVAFKGNIELSKLLIENGANINAQNNKGTTALIFATQYNQEATVDFLIKNNADKSIEDNDGKTALDYANDRGFKNIIAILN